MKRKLIVPLDFSSYSDLQVRMAIEWTEKFDIEPFFVHQLDLIIPSLAGPETRLKIEYDFKRELDSKFDALISQITDGKKSFRLEFTREALPKYLTSPDVLAEGDIILMGIKGAGKLKRILIGSNTINVINDLKNPLIGLPLHINGFLPKNLIVGTHYNYPINYKVFSDIVNFLKPELASVVFVSILGETDEYGRAVAYLKKLSLDFQHQVATEHILFEGVDPFSGLKQYCKVMEDDFLVVQKGSRSFTDAIFRTFMVNELVFDASVPLIVLP